MTPKQRFEATLNFKKPDDMVAFMELEFHIYEELIGKKPINGFEFEKLSAKERKAALYKNAEIMIETAEIAGHDAIRSIAGYWEISQGEPAFLWLPDEESILNQIRTLKKIGGDKYFIIGSCSVPMGIPDGNHIYEYVYELFDNPYGVKEKNQKMLDYALEWQKKQLDAGADTVLNAVDLAFNSGPFISIEQCEEFFFPYFNKWVDSLKSQGIVSIWHSDGNLQPLIDRILESGVTAIQCVDPLAGMDIVEVKKKVNKKLALIGNIDCSMLQMGTKEEIEAEVKRVVENCKGDGGFVLSGCNAIFHGISAENYMTMVEARFKYGKES